MVFRNLIGMCLSVDLFGVRGRVSDLRLADLFESAGLHLWPNWGSFQARVSECSSPPHSSGAPVGPLLHRLLCPQVPESLFIF